MSNIYLNTAKEIHDPRDLIGRNEDRRGLSKLLRVLERGASIQLIGERRSGKSSLIRCAIKKILDNYEIYNAVPVYINFKQYSQSHGTELGYRVLVCELLTALNQFDNVWKNNIFTVRRKKITKQKDYFSYGKYLDGMKEIQNRFSSYKVLFLSIINKVINNDLKIYLFIDEYEFMVLSTFEGQPGALHTLRDCIRDHINFSCVISGARSWDKYAQNIGSDDFNLIDHRQYLNPLNNDDSINFVKKALSELEDLDKSLIKTLKNNIHLLTGGSPYLLTLICRDIYLSGEYNLEQIENNLKSHFSNIWDRLTSKEKATLKGQIIEETRSELIGYGLLRKEKNWRGSQKLIPNGELWDSFINSQPNINVDLNNKIDDKQISNDASSENMKWYRDYHRIDQLGKSINDKISVINSNLKSKKVDIIFDLKTSDNWSKKLGDLSKKCDTKDKFGSFINNLYQIMIESTSAEVPDNNGNSNRINAARYPDKFNRKNNRAPDCFYKIGALRHKFAHNDETEFFEPKKFSYADAQEFYLSHRNNIGDTSNHWFVLQESVMREFCDFLEELLRWSEDI